MPELPEVETMCRGIRPILGQRVKTISQPPCGCRPCAIQPSINEMQQQLAGQQVVAIERRGKRVMIVFENATRLVIEPRMSGLVLLAQPPGVDHLRLRIDFVDNHATAAGPLFVWDRRGLGTIRLMSPSEYETQVNQRLGEDALTISMETLRERLRDSSRPIKVSLLDQTAVAGIGNLYASEILFIAGIDPRVTCAKLTGPQWTRLHTAIGIVLNEAVAQEGSTLSDGTYRNALNDPGSYQNMHRVYDRAGETCRRCNEGMIVRIVQAQRSTFYCPVCQRRSGKHATIAV